MNCTSSESARLLYVVAMQRGCKIDKGPRHGPLQPYATIHVMGFSVVAVRACLIGKLHVAFSFFSTLVFKKSHTVTICFAVS